jgi:pimeloyl-ACP methyl ester carboxylesterase
LTLVGERWPATGGPERGTVILLHGSGQTRHSWLRTARALSSGGWSAITFDLRGHGDSSWDPEGQYTPGAIAADLERFVDLIDTPPVLVGASLGGIAALVLEARRRVASHLVMVDVTPVLERQGAARILQFMSAGLDGFDTLEDAAAAIDAYSPRPRPSSPEGLKKNLRLGNDGKWRWHWDPRLLDNAGGERDALVIAQTREAASQISIPTLLVRGAASDVLTEQGARDMLRLIPHAVLVEVDAGHMVTGDDNDVLARSLLSFLTPPIDSIR